MTKGSFKWLLGQKEKTKHNDVLTDDKLFDRLVEKMMKDMGFNEEARKSFQQKSKADKEALILPWLKKSHSQSVQGLNDFGQPKLKRLCVAHIVCYKVYIPKSILWSQEHTI